MIRHRLGLLLLVPALALSACQREQATGSPAPPAEAPRQVPAEAAQPGITASDAWIRASADNAPVAGAFLHLHNGSDRDDRLLELLTDAAARVEIHESLMEDGMSRMRALPDGLPLPAGQHVALEPGGLHLMLMQPTRAFTPGDSVTMELRFEHAPPQQVSFSVRELTATGAHAH